MWSGNNSIRLLFFFTNTKNKETIQTQIHTRTKYICYGNGQCTKYTHSQQQQKNNSELLSRWFGHARASLLHWMTLTLNTSAVVRWAPKNAASFAHCHFLQTNKTLIVRIFCNHHKQQSIHMKMYIWYLSMLVRWESFDYYRWCCCDCCTLLSTTMIVLCSSSLLLFHSVFCVYLNLFVFYSTSSNTKYTLKVFVTIKQLLNFISFHLQSQCCAQCRVFFSFFNNFLLYLILFFSFWLKRVFCCSI